MAGRILLVNPIGKRSKKTAHSLLAGRTRIGGRKRKKNPMGKRKATMKRRTAAQRAATKRLIAFNKGRKRNPIRRKRRRAVASTAVSVVRRRRRNPIRIARRVHRRRRNPIRMKGLVGSLLMPAFTASTGALLLDVLWAKLPIPANLKAGTLQYVTKGVGAVALALVAEKSKMVNKQTADALGIGALTVVLHDALRNALKNAVPALGLSEYVGGLGYINAGWPAGSLDYPNTAAAPMGEYVGEYMGGANYDADGAYDFYYGRG